MNARQTRWIPVALLAASATTQAFTDSNAEMKELAADPTARVVVTGKARPVQTVWVPPTAKALDSPRPVWPQHRHEAGAQAVTVAAAGPPPRAR